MKKNEQLTEEQTSEMIEKEKKKAEKLLANEQKFDEFILKLEKKLKGMKGGDKLANIPIMVSMIKSYWKKEYTNIPMNTLVAIVACLIYWLSPIDLIPDAAPGVGYIDDIAFMSAVIAGGVLLDIKKYVAWRDGTDSSSFNPAEN